jgi:hypothetical protein
MTLRPTAALLAAVLALAAPLAAQEIVIRGDDRSPAAEAAREVLRRNQFVWMDRDTVLGPDFHAPGDLVVYDAAVRLEGSVEGTVLVVGGHFYVRPRARVGGPIAVLSGGAYPSGLAVTGPVLTTEPGADVVIDQEVTPEGRVRAGVSMRRPETHPVLGYGLAALPTYDRVNALTVAAGVTLRPTRREDGSRFDAWVSYRTARRSFGGGVRGDLPLGDAGVHLRAEASRATRTNDAWMRGDLMNTLTSLFLGTDYRDYHESDRAELRLVRPLPQPPIAGEGGLVPYVAAAVHRDRSLPARRPFAFVGRDGLDRFNPPVVEETFVSALAGSAFHWRGRSSALDGAVGVEQVLAHSAAPDTAFPGAMRFTHAVGWARYTATALADHSLEVYVRGAAPLNAGGAPPQRWGILGGSTTLPTLEIAHFRGDHLGFVETTYGIPIHALQLPIVGPPSLELWHAAGAAWSAAEPAPAWVQNVGVGARARLVYVRLLVDPAERPLRPMLTGGLSVPGF